MDLDPEIEEEDFEAATNSSHASSFKRRVITLLIAIPPLISVTYAASININSQATFEFGQGVTRVTSCGSLSLKPIATFESSTAGGNTNTLIYPTIGDSIGYGFGSPGTKIGFPEVGGVQGVFNYVSLRVSNSVGDQNPGITDPGNIVGTHHAVLVISGDPAATFYSPAIGTLSADGRTLSIPANNAQFDLRIITNFTGYAAVNIYREIGAGIYETLPAESVDIESSPSSDAGNYASRRFELTNIYLNNISSNCIGKDFLIKAWGDGGQDSLNVATGWPGNALRVSYDSVTSQAASPYSGFAVVQDSSNAIHLSIARPMGETRLITKFTVESLDKQ